jgi:predicted ATPase
MATRGLRFKHLTLVNWRNFTNVDVALQPRVIVVGPNASGKSNLLDVFRFLHDIVSPIDGGFQTAVTNRGGVAKLRSLAAHQSLPGASISVVVGTDDEDIWNYYLRFTKDRRGKPTILEERIQGRKTDISRPNKLDQRDPERLTQTYIEQVSQNKSYREFTDFLESVRYLHLVPEIIRGSELTVRRESAFDPYGRDFLEQLARTPVKTRDKWLKKINNALKFAVPQLSELELWKDELGRPHLRGKYLHWRPKGSWQTEEEFSDGTIRLVGILWSLLNGKGPVLFEEPELSLHPAVVRYIPQVLARVKNQTSRQIFLSTHSAELLEDKGIGLDEVIVLAPQEEGTLAKVASGLKNVRALLRGGGSMAEAVLPITRPNTVEQLGFFAVE